MGSLRVPAIQRNIFSRQLSRFDYKTSSKATDCTPACQGNVFINTYLFGQLDGTFNDNLRRTIRRTGRCRRYCFPQIFFCNHLIYHRFFLCNNDIAPGQFQGIFFACQFHQCQILLINPIISPRHQRPSFRRVGHTERQRIFQRRT